MKTIVTLAVALFALSASAAPPCSSSGQCGVPLTAPSFNSTAPAGDVAFQSKSGARLQLNDPADGEHVWLTSPNDDNQLNLEGSGGSAAFYVHGPAGVTILSPDIFVVANGGAEPLWVDYLGTRIGGQHATSISASFRATVATDVGPVAPQTCVDTPIAVTGAAAGADAVCAPPPTFPAGLSATCFVSAPNVAQFRLCNVTTGIIYPQTLTYGVRVFNP